MFLVSGPDLVVETCRSGIMGTFPALNQRTSEGYTAWLDEIQERLDRIDAETGAPPSPFAVNLIVHKTNARLARDLEITVQHRVPIVITSLGAVRDVVDAIHSYGGLVFHDVINLHHSNKASEAGVDGLIAVCAGAGGHAGLLNPFAFIAEIRQIFDKTLILSGAITHGRQIAAAQLLGADLAYLGTRFINTREALAPPGHKEMILASTAKDIVYTSAISGVHANFLAREHHRCWSRSGQFAIVRQAYRFIGRRGESLERCVVGRARSRRYSRYSFGGRALPALGGGISRGDSGAYLGPAGATPIA